MARKGRGLAAAIVERPAHRDPVLPPVEWSTDAVQRWTAAIAEVFEGSLPSLAVRSFREPGGSELAPHPARLATEASPRSPQAAPPPPLS